jgi:serine/threonine-protein kinase
VYQSDASGRVEIYLSPFPDIHEKRWQLSSDGGTHPVWAPDGREVFFRSSDGRLLAVSVETEPTVAIGRPVAVLDGLVTHNDAAGDDHTYDVAPDGKRFLVIREIENVGDRALARFDEIQVVLNWFEELKQKAGG